jgi:hypothetical protein
MIDSVEASWGPSLEAARLALDRNVHFLIRLAELAKGLLSPIVSECRCIALTLHLVLVYLQDAQRLATPLEVGDCFLRNDPKRQEAEPWDTFNSSISCLK